MIQLISRNSIYNRREQRYQPNRHQLLIPNDDNLRDIANNIEVGSRLFVHGQLKSFYNETNDGHKKIVYYIRPRKLIVNQEFLDEATRDDTTSDVL